MHIKKLIVKLLAWFERQVDPFPVEAPLCPPPDLWGYFCYCTKGSLGFIILISIFTGMTAAIEVSLFAVLGRIVDWLSVQEGKALLTRDFERLLIVGVLLLIGFPTTSLLRSLVLYQGILSNFAMRVRWDAHRYLLDQSWSFYQKDFAGRVATKVMQTALGVRDSVTKLADILVYVVIYFLGNLMIVGSANICFLVPMALWLSLYILILRFFIPKLRRLSEVQANSRSVMTGRLVDSYTNINTVKLFSHSGREAAYARSGMEQFLDTVYPQMRLITLLTSSVTINNSLLIFHVTALAIYLWSRKSVTGGEIAVAVGLSIRLHGMAHWIMWETATLFENIGIVKDGLSTLSKAREVEDQPEAKDLVVSRGEIKFDSVEFGYGDRGTVFSRFNLTIAPGERVGLVGRSGAGKSTLINLLTRFYDVQDGSITIDGQDISAVTQESLRAAIGLVTQDTSLLHRAIRENILYGNPKATDEEMINAAKRAQAHEFISRFQDHRGARGYDVQVGERGVKLSGGQRQRVAIARVLLKNAPILILDEATSALDSEAEEAIKKIFRELMQGKTVIAIAHRLSTIAELDRLIVIDQGRVVEEGTHEQLVKAAGLYARLWEHQSGGFLGLD